MRRHLLCLAIGAALLGASTGAFAVTDTESNPSFQFALANPGARSTGMGGAFLGLADDATAAYANPAGLTQLVTPEVSAEFRHTEYSVPFISGGSATINPFNGSGLQVSQANSSVDSLSFLSVVFPHDRWSFAFFRDDLLHFNSDSARGALAGEPVTENGELFGTAFPVQTHSDIKVIDYGFAVAFKAADNVSLGAGLSYYDFNIGTFSNRYGFAPTFTDTSVILNRQEQFGNDKDFGINLGARVVFNSEFSAGATYRRGPKFSYEATSAAFANVVQNADGSFTPTATTPTIVTDLKDVPFKVPDQFGAGVSWHPTDALVVNFDLDYIQYSQLTHGLQSLFGNDATIASRLSIPNGTEIHLGGEYTFTQMSHPLSVRAGVWHDPRHSIEFTGDPGEDLGSVALAVLYNGGKGPQNHGAIGLGWAFPKFQIDAAADFSDVTDTYSISAVYHF